MGIILQVYKDGNEIIRLSDNTIQNIEFRTISDEVGDYHYPVILRGISITGLIKGDSLNEPFSLMDDNGNFVEKIREIDSVRKFINWAVLPTDTEYCMNVILSISDSAGKTVKEDIFMNMFPVGYTEQFRDNKGTGEFQISLNEMLRKEKVKYNSEGILKAIQKP